MIINYFKHRLLFSPHVKDSILLFLFEKKRGCGWYSKHDLIVVEGFHMSFSYLGHISGTLTSDKKFRCNTRAWSLRWI